MEYIYGFAKSVINTTSRIIETCFISDTNNTNNTFVNCYSVIISDISIPLTELLVSSKLNNILTVLNNFIIGLPLLESFILIDGTICSLIFLKHYILLKLSERRFSSKIILDYKLDIIKKYNKIYTLYTIDRYLLYFTICLNYSLISRMGFDLDFYKFIFILLVFPSVQNRLINISSSSLCLYLDNKEIFIKYSISKLIVSSIQNLHNDIDDIKNFNIFIVYSTLSNAYLYDIIKNYLIICLLYFLKTREYLYFYYKAIKTAYLWNTGYNFTEVSLYDSVYLANLIIKEKRWNELSKMEVVNMFYVLINSKFFSDTNSNIYVSSTILTLQCFSIWSIVSLLKITINYLIMIIPLYYKILFSIITICMILIYRTREKIKKIITCIIIYYLLIFNINDIIITLVLIGNEIVYYILGELYFFIINIRSIRKVVKVYEKKKKHTITENEFIFC